MHNVWYLQNFNDNGILTKFWKWYAHPYSGWIWLNFPLTKTQFELTPIGLNPQAQMELQQNQCRGILKLKLMLMRRLKGWLSNILKNRKGSLLNSSKIRKGSLPNSLENILVKCRISQGSLSRSLWDAKCKMQQRHSLLEARRLHWTLGRFAKQSNIS